MNAPIREHGWPAGEVPIAAAMISLNEAHNMAEVLENPSGFASEGFLVDNYICDETVDIAIQHGAVSSKSGFAVFGISGTSQSVICRFLRHGR